MSNGTFFWGAMAVVFCCHGVLCGAGGEPLTKAKKLADLGVFAGTLDEKIENIRTPGVGVGGMFGRGSKITYPEGSKLVEGSFVSKKLEKPLPKAFVPQNKSLVSGLVKEPKKPVIAPFDPNDFKKRLIAVKPRDFTGIASAILEELATVPEEFAFTIAHKMGYEASIRDLKIVELSEAIEKLEKELEDCSQEKQKNAELVGEELKAVEQARDQEKERAEELLNEGKKRDEEGRRLGAEVAEKQSKIAALDAQIGKLNDDIKKNKLECEQQQKLLDICSGEKSLLLQEVDKLKSDLSAQSEQLKKYEEETGALKAENERLMAEKKIFGQLMEKDANLKNEYDKLKSKEKLLGKYMIVDQKLEEKNKLLELKLQEFAEVNKLKK